MADFSAKRVLARAWNLTHQERRKFFWYGFWPAFFSIAVGVVIVYFQTQLLMNSQLFQSQHEKGFLDIISPFVRWAFSPEIPTAAVISFGILIFVSAFFLPVFSEGAIIGMVSQYQRERRIERGMGYGFVNFLPLFKFSLFKNSMKPFSVALEFLFFLRFLGMGAFFLLEIVFGLWMIFSILGLFFFTYTSQFIVLEKSDPGKGMMQSLGKVSFFFGETFSLVFLFFLIEIRVLFNVLIIFFLPAIMMSLGGLMAHSYIGYFAEGILAFVVLFISAVLSGTLFVLGNVAWTLAFLELRQIQKESSSEE